MLEEGALTVELWDRFCAAAPGIPSRCDDRHGKASQAQQLDGLDRILDGEVTASSHRFVFPGTSVIFFDDRTMLHICTHKFWSGTKSVLRSSNLQLNNPVWDI
jgi:hypothetical protein